MSDYYDEPHDEPYDDDWFVDTSSPQCICEDGDWPHEHCPIHGLLESFEIPPLSQLPQEAPDTIPQHWGFVITAADQDRLALETYEDIMGYQGWPDKDLQALEGESAHKPPRSDIQKYKTAWEQARAEDELRKIENQDDPKLQRLAREWKEKTALEPVEAAALMLYQKHYTGAMRSPNLTGNDPAQWAFVETGRELSNSAEAAQLAGLDPLRERLDNWKPVLGKALKKFEYGQYPKLYSGIKDTMDDFLRVGGNEEDGWSHKLWPWAVSELKRQWAKNIWEKPSSTWGNPHYRNWPSFDRPHLVDIVDQTGKLLDKLRQEHRMPQGFDVNQLKSLDEMEQWLMDYKREHGTGDDGGQTVHEFDDGWTVKKLHQPNQLEWEGDQMNHCVGGYWQPVRDGKSYIYSIRDPEGKPHATLEFNPPYDEDYEYYKLLGDLIPRGDNDALAKVLEEHEVGQKPQGRFIYPVWPDAEAYGEALSHARGLAIQRGEDDSPYSIRAEDLNELAPHYGLFERASSPHGGEPFVDPDTSTPVYMGIRMRHLNGDRANAVRPYDIDPESNWEKKAILHQHMGPHDSTPDAQANQHIREWFDHHRKNGWQIERKRDFFYPNDWHDFGSGSWPDGWYTDDYGRPVPIQNDNWREQSGATRSLDKWWDHFKQNPGRWTGHDENEVDMYGIPYGNDNDSGLRVDWDDLNHDVMRSLSQDYDTGAYKTSDWPGLARAYWHAFHLADGGMEDNPLLGHETAKSNMQKQIEQWEEKLSDYSMENWDYARKGALDEVREKYEEMGGKPPEGFEPGDRYDLDDGADEDTWQEAEDAVRQSQEDWLYGDNYKFVNYLYWLNEHPNVPRSAKALFDAHRNQAFPRPDDVIPKSPEPTGTEDMPGTFSKVAEMMPDWLTQQPQGQWYKWGFHPDRGALMWTVNGQDGDKDDMQAGRAHIDMMNKTWGRPGRYPFHPQDSTGVIFHKPDTNQVFVNQYPRRNGERINPLMLPALEQKIRTFHPDAEIVWPDNPSYAVRTSGFDFGPPTFEQPGYSQAFRYHPEEDKIYWGSGHGVIDSRLYRMGLGPEWIRQTVEGRWRPSVNEVEFYNEQPGVDTAQLRQRLLQEASERAYERPWGDGSPFLGSQVEPVDTEHGKLLERMRLAYEGAHLAGDVIDFQQYRDERHCPVCNGRIQNDNGLVSCPGCGWLEGDPVDTCPNCGGKNTIQMTHRFRQWPYECVNCHEVFNDDERNRLH